MTENEQKLVNALRCVLMSHNPTSVRAGAMLLEEIAGPFRNCPLCKEPWVVIKGYVKIHFASTVQQRPCPASFKNTIGGILL